MYRAGVHNSEVTAKRYIYSKRSCEHMLYVHIFKWMYWRTALFWMIILYEQNSQATAGNNNMQYA